MTARYLIFFETVSYFLAAMGLSIWQVKLQFECVLHGFETSYDYFEKKKNNTILSSRLESERDRLEFSTPKNKSNISKYARIWVKYIRFFFFFECLLQSCKKFPENSLIFQVFSFKIQIEEENLYRCSYSN